MPDSWNVFATFRTTANDLNLKMTPLNRREMRHEFGMWYEKYIAPLTQGARGIRLEDVFREHSCMGVAEAREWIEKALPSCDAVTCFFIGNGESAVLASRPSIHEIRSVATNGEMFIVCDEARWSAAISRYDEWGPFVIFRNDDEAH